MDHKDLEAALSKVFVDCDGQEYGYSNNITAAMFAIARAIDNHAKSQAEAANIIAKAISRGLGIP